MHRLQLLLSMAVLLSPGLILVGPAQDLLKIDASKMVFAFLVAARFADSLFSLPPYQFARDTSRLAKAQI